MKIERIEEARLSLELEAEIAALLNRAFDTEFGDFSYFQQRHHVRLIASDQAEIVGHMALGFRAVRLGDRLLDVATLADVATDPAHRGKGIASALMAAMIEEGRAMGADLIMLFGDRPIYAGHGFVAKPNPTTWLDLTDRRSNALRHGTPEGLMILPLRDILWDDRAELDLLGHKF